MESETPQKQNNGEGTAPKPAMRKPVFVKVEQLKPGTNGHNLTLKVQTSSTVLQKKDRNLPTPIRGSSGQTRIAECLVGDETGTILFTARNDQVDLLKVGSTVNFRNAKIDMFKGSMRLVVDKWGLVEVVNESANFEVKLDNNLSAIEYELVNVVAQE
ncbi:uncharacterized protein At4g28440-like [Impatiens glandulifera]|uniref:uncharacterized protein At4g28440-like n=1 Tax=Impatiens glandulifera TaxID=253017 RepID=UPI001FB14CA8|nr:uncharacterized protein At4g28440-like [Impatiens glandulifera]